MTATSKAPQFKVVISDCHLSAGRFFERKLNPHEDFHFDEEMADMFRHFSTGEYGETLAGPVDVELFINGDFLDFLNVPVDGEFEDQITETVALTKTDAILAGHPRVMEALRTFASKPGKRITYMVGNHDADLFFEKVRERIIRAWDPEGRYPSDKVRIITETDHVRFDGGVEIHHGNQLEAVHALDFEKPFQEVGDTKLLHIPWGSFYVLKIINRLKGEREFLDKVRPIKAYLFFGMLFDPLFTIRYLFLTIFYFFKTRFVYSSKRRSRIGDTLRILKQETGSFLLDLEREARELLDEKQDVHTVIFGHTHLPMNKVYPDGKQYINTGTWTKMINLDWRTLGQRFCLTFALVRIADGRAHCELRDWVGESGPHRAFRN